MNPILRTAFASLLVIGAASSLGGCKSDCTTEDGKTTCVGESVQRFDGTITAKQSPWAAGKSLTVATAGGNIRSGDKTTSITVSRRSEAAARVPSECPDANQVCVKFFPFNYDTAENQAEATRQMKSVADGGNLDLSVADDGANTLVQVRQENKNSSYNSSLSAVVDVIVPDAFDGIIVANTGTGGVAVNGARNAVKATSAGVGDILVRVDSITPGAPDSVISTDLGDVTLTLPTAANVNVHAEAPSTNERVIIDSASGWTISASSTANVADVCGNTACSGAAQGKWNATSTSGSVQIKFQ